MTRRANNPWLASCLICVCLAGCAGTPDAFATRFPDNSDQDVQELLRRISSAPPPQSPPIAIGVTPTPTKLFAFDLSSRSTLWQTPVQTDVAPYRAGDTAVIQSGDEIVGFDLRSGARRFSTSAEGRKLNGAAGDGPNVAIVMSEGMGTHASSEVALIRGGSVSWRHELPHRAGQPAVVGSLVLVPWSNQFLSAIDVGNGKEVARIRVRDGVIAHALYRSGDVYVGSRHGIARVTASVGSGSLKGSGHLAVPEEKLPGRPLFLRDVYAPGSAPAADSAQHRIALTWQPRVVESIRTGLEDDNLYLVFYRFLFALDPNTLGFRWVYLHPSDIVGAGAQSGGVAFADEGGNFGFVGARSGALAWSQSAGVSATMARLPSDGGGTGPGEPASPNDLRARLLAAAQDTDARLVPARLLAVDFLAAMDDAEATSNLIALCDDDRVAPPVRNSACTKLKDRAIGKDHLLVALERHAGYLEGTRPPPVGALAKAAASLGEKRAVSLLIAHLKDPATPSRDLVNLITALQELGDPSAAAPMGDFLRLYHADPIDEHLVKALELIPDALVALSGPVAEDSLQTVAGDGLAAEGVRQKAQVALDGLRAAAAAAKKADEAEQQAQEKEAEAAKEAEDPDPSKYVPTHLSVAVVKQALLPVRDQLQACLTAGDKPIFQARVVLVVDAGKVLMVSVLPEKLQSCVEPLVRAQKFPVTKAGKKEQLTYTLKRQ